MPIAWRGTGWLNAAYHARFREAMLHAAAREGLVCPTYCLMPDHIHLVWMGLHRRTDQLTGMKFLREHLGKALTRTGFSIRRTTMFCARNNGSGRPSGESAST